MIPSRSNTSRLASAVAQLTGWPANVMPWAKLAVPDRNGSAIVSRAMTPPRGA